jgi:hypothetical protein
VQLSSDPIAYFTVRGAKRRSKAELVEAAKEWVRKKFEDQVRKKREELCQGIWTRELVLWRTKHPEEVEACKEAGVEKILWLEKDILDEIDTEDTVISSASGGDLVRLILEGRKRTSSHKA